MARLQPVRRLAGPLVSQMNRRQSNSDRRRGHVPCPCARGPGALQCHATNCAQLRRVHPLSGHRHNHRCCCCHDRRSATARGAAAPAERRARGGIQGGRRGSHCHWGHGRRRIGGSRGTLLILASTHAMTKSMSKKYGSCTIWPRGAGRGRGGDRPAAPQHAWC